PAGGRAKWPPLSGGWAPVGLPIHQALYHSGFTAVLLPCPPRRRVFRTLALQGITVGYRQDATGQDTSEAHSAKGRPELLFPHAGASFFARFLNRRRGGRVA